MPQYEIRKTLDCVLLIDCENEAEAQTWASRTVATLEDESGKPIEPEAVDRFDADSDSPQIVEMEPMS